MKVPINESAVIDLEAPVLPAYEVLRKGRTCWVVWCKYCQEWHRHAPVEGHREAHCPDSQSPYWRTGYNLAYAGKDRDRNALIAGAAEGTRKCQERRGSPTRIRKLLKNIDRSPHLWAPNKGLEAKLDGQIVIPGNQDHCPTPSVICPLRWGNDFANGPSDSSRKKEKPVLA